MNLDKELEIALKAAKEAGNEIMKIYNASENLNISIKENKTPLTEADEKSHNVITSHLIKTEFEIISEEGEHQLSTDNSSKDYWLIDPLDGTKEFIKRNGEFTVNIAFISSNKVALGVVYLPVKQEMFYAIKGKGAWKVVGEGTPFQISANTFSLSDQNLEIVVSRSHLDEKTTQFIEQLKNPNLKRSGSSLKLMLVAEGSAHIYPRFAPTMEWDIAASQIIVEEAGGKVLSVENGKPLNYGARETLRNPYFICAGKLEEDNIKAYL